MKTLLLLRGLPGNGKSTLAEKIKWMGGMEISADEFHMINGIYNWKPERVGYAHAKCQEYTEMWMKRDVLTIAVHNTFTTEKEMKPYYELAEKYGYMVHSLIVENRHGGTNVHDVPEETIDKMERRFSIKLR